MMKITRLFTGDNGQSHFEEIEVALKQHGGAETSRPQPAASILFRRTPPGLIIGDFHNAPRRQYLITLQGELEIETGGGTVRRFGPGSVLLAEDLTGKGHISRDVGTEPRISVLVSLTD